MRPLQVHESGLCVDPRLTPLPLPFSPRPGAPPSPAAARPLAPTSTPPPPPRAAGDKLADEFHTSEKVLIADVDCTGAGEPLCERFDVQGFPTLKSFAAPETDGEDYDGGREFEDLLAFAKELKPGCGLETKENCSPEDLAELEAAIALGEDKIKARGSCHFFFFWILLCVIGRRDHSRGLAACQWLPVGEVLTSGGARLHRPSTPSSPTRSRRRARRTTSWWRGCRHSASR